MLTTSIDHLPKRKQDVLDLAERVRQACADKLATFMGPRAVSKLPPVPQPVNTEGFPPPPDNLKYLKYASVAHHYVRPDLTHTCRSRDENR